MPPAVLAQAFEPFYTTKETGKGSGLGLSMVYGFARQSGGTAQITSAVGKGTTVDLFLPRTFALAEEEHHPTPTAPRPALPATILVVDDDDDVRTMSADALRDFGYRVFEARSGVEALAIIEREAVDLLFSDVVMPGGINGVDLALQARQIRNPMSILLTTGYADALAQVPPQDAAFQILPKPFRPSELGTRVHEMLAEVRACGRIALAATATSHPTLWDRGV
jgi:CheY-like chemotaxis protein